MSSLSSLSSLRAAAQETTNAPATHGRWGDTDRGGGTERSVRPPPAPINPTPLGLLIGGVEIISEPDANGFAFEDGANGWAEGLAWSEEEPHFILKTPTGARIGARSYGDPVCAGANGEYAWWISTRDFLLVSADGARLLYYGEHEGEASHLEYTGTNVGDDVPTRIYRGADGAHWFVCEYAILDDDSGCTVTIRAGAHPDGGPTMLGPDTPKSCEPRM